MWSVKFSSSSQPQGFWLFLYYKTSRNAKTDNFYLFIYLLSVGIVENLYLMCKRHGFSVAVCVCVCVCVRACVRACVRVCDYILIFMYRKCYHNQFKSGRCKTDKPGWTFHHKMVNWHLTWNSTDIFQSQWMIYSGLSEYMLCITELGLFDRSYITAVCLHWTIAARLSLIS